MTKDEKLDVLFTKVDKWTIDYPRQFMAAGYSRKWVNKVCKKQVSIFTAEIKLLNERS